MIKVKVFIIDSYNKYCKEGNEVKIFWVNRRPWCIREVEMEWGTPVV